MQTLLQDIRYGIRTLLKSPGFTVVAVLSLALGIGANTAIFTLIDSLLLQQLPVANAERLALIGNGNAYGIFGGIPGREALLISVPEWKALRAQNNILIDACGLFSLPWKYRAHIAGGAAPEPIQGRVVTGNYFSVLGVKAAAGRLFTDAVDQGQGGHPDVVLSYSFWKRRWAANPSAIGQTLRIADTMYTVIGVTAPEFFGTTVGESPDAFFPLSMLKQLPPFFDLQGNMDADLQVIARLQPGVTLQQASAASTVLFRNLLRSYAGTAPSKRDLHEIEMSRIEWTPAAKGLSALRSQFSLPLKVLMVVVALVLLIACANVANLLLARAAAREREISIRLAVGSSRSRTIRQLLTESLLLASAGGLLGVVFAMWGSQLLLSLVSTGPDRVPLNVDPNGRVLLFTLVVSMLTGILFGTAPALRASSVDLNKGLRDGRSGTASRSRLLISRGLVVSQVALSLLLLVGAGLFIRSFRNLEQIDSGFRREGALLFSLDTDSAGYKEDDRLGALYRNIEARVGAVPGVQAAAFSFFVFNQGVMDFGVSIEGHPDVLEQGKSMHLNVTGPAYLQAAGIPLLAGRYFNAHDTASSQKVAVINAKAAREIFGNRSPIGAHMSIGRPEHGHDVEIVGVAQNTKDQELRQETPWQVYAPYTQREQYLGRLLVRTQGDPTPIAAQVRRIVAEADPNLPINEVTTFSELIDRSVNTEHLLARLSGFFCALAVFLAALGLYGILSYSVVRRTSEIGVRMALGAQRAGVLWMVLRESLLLIGIGVLIGVPAALVTSRLIESMLYGLKAADTMTLVAAILVLALIGSLAGLLPARRASNVDPMTALRYE